MPRRDAVMIQDQSGAIVRDAPTSEGQDPGETPEGSTALPWLFPWLLAMTGILITLALMR